MGGRAFCRGSTATGAVLITGALALVSGCGGSSGEKGGSSDATVERSASVLPSYDTSCPEKSGSTTVRGSVFNAVPGSYSLNFSVPQGSYNCDGWSGISTPGRAFDGLSVSPGYPERFRLEDYFESGIWTMNVSETGRLAIRVSERLTLEQRKVWPVDENALPVTNWGDSSVTYKNTAPADDRVREDSDPGVVKEACSKNPGAFGLGVYKGRLSWLFCYQWFYEYD